jgi:hypothetical protein
MKVLLTALVFALVLGWVIGRVGVGIITFVA